MGDGAPLKVADAGVGPGLCWPSGVWPSGRARGSSVLSAHLCAGTCQNQGAHFTTCVCAQMGPSRGQESRRMGVQEDRRQKPTA